MLDPSLLWQLLCSLPFLALAVFMIARGWDKERRKTDSIVARTEEHDSATFHPMVAVSRRHMEPKSALRRGKVRSRAAERAVKRRSFWGRISLASRRRATGRVPARPRVIHTTLVSLLQLIFDLPVGALSNAQRESLAACLPSYSERCKPGERRKAMPFRPRNWVMKKYWPTIAAEPNQQIRGDVILMAAQFLWKQRFSHSIDIWESEESLAINCLFRVLEEQNVPHHVRKCALSMQTDIFYHGNPTSLENRLRAVRYWLRLIEEHRAPFPHSNDMIRLAAHLMTSCARRSRRQDGHPHVVASALLAHDRTLPFLFNEMSGAAASKEAAVGWWWDRLGTLGDLLSTLLVRTSAQQRVQMLSLHYSELVETFHLLSAHHISSFFYHPEFRPIFTQSISLIEKLWKDVQHTCEGSQSGAHWRKMCPKAHTAQTIADILEDALQDGPRLQHVLGLGVLAISAHFASDETDVVSADGYAHEADIFRHVLNLHPEWNEYFKQLTKDGNAANQITSVGRRIPDRPKRPPTLYVLEEPEQQEEHSESTVTSRNSTDPKREPAAEQREDADEDVVTFADLPPHFLEQVSRSMAFADLAAFRSSCKQALDAVGRSLRALDIVRLAQQLWPKKHAPGVTIYSLYSMQNEMVLLAAWHRLDLCTTIDFSGVGTMNASQLETAFGIEPRNNVKKLGLAGIVVMPSVWTILARLFPGVRNVRCTESACQFPASITQEAMLMDGDKIGGAELVDRKELGKRGQLSEERIITLRCLKTLFPAACYLYVD